MPRRSLADSSVTTPRMGLLTRWPGLEKSGGSSGSVRSSGRRKPSQDEARDHSGKRDSDSEMSSRASLGGGVGAGAVHTGQSMQRSERRSRQEKQRIVHMVGSKKKRRVRETGLGLYGKNPASSRRKLELSVEKGTPFPAFAPTLCSYDVDVGSCWDPGGRMTPPRSHPSHLHTTPRQSHTQTQHNTRKEDHENAWETGVCTLLPSPSHETRDIV